MRLADQYSAHQPIPDPEDDGTPAPDHNPKREEPGEPVPLCEPDDTSTDCDTGPSRPTEAKHDRP